MTNLSGTNLNNGSAVGPQGEGMDSPSTFPKYPEYKDSGVVWLGGIPAHWNIKKFRYVFEESPEKITDEVVGDMLSVSGYRGIEVKQYDDEGRRRTDEELFGYRVVRPGQLVVNTMWLNYAGLGVSEHEGHVSPAYRSYWIDLSMDKRFIHHLMRSGTYVQGYTRLLTGIRPNSLQMGRDDLMGFPVLLPTKSEQTQIARFLDHETARIDALIEEQQRLIELLKEKRQAVISHAVTKGLDPTVPMKDSGVEWLGEVPAHWPVNTLRRCLVEHRQGYYSSAPYVDDGVKLLRITDIRRLGGIDTSNCPRVEESAGLDDFILKKGDVVFARTGGAGLFGIVSEVEEKLAYASYLIRFRFDLKALSHEFMRYVFIADSFQLSLKASIHGGVNQNIHAEDIKEVYICLPPLGEQKEISNFLKNQCGIYSRLIDEALLTTDLMQERRSALISAAVTGKIDVRGWQPPASTQTSENNTQMTV